MRKIIWACWFQGRDVAPELVRKCLQSWQEQNPSWDFRCLDKYTVGRYVDLASYIDLSRQKITAASLSDILRLLLLHEYGGVWVDATTLCNQPLDEWLEQPLQNGFFAFSRPAEDREIATWFLAANPGNRLLSRWAALAIAYWQGREFTQDYFWVHHLFGELISIDLEAYADWQAVPHISADGPHTALVAGLLSDYDQVSRFVNWSAPLFKLTHRLESIQTDPTTTLIGHLLSSIELPTTPSETGEPTIPGVPSIAHLSVSTENLGDHIQIVAGERLIARVGWAPQYLVDRDDEIANPPPDNIAKPCIILLNGWFKNNPAQWPPHPEYIPLYLGFHIRLFQSPSLISPEAIAHYKAHAPVGCRDRYTLSLLRERGVDTFLSHCVSLSFPRRLPEPKLQTDVFVVSRDKRILEHLPDDLGPLTYLSHYSGNHDFFANLEQACELLETYRIRARLIITTLLHCALPAIAMGIPVVVFYPLNEEPARTSDKQRFSSLSELVRVFELSEINLVDWRGYCPDVGDIKFRMVNSFFTMVKKYCHIATPPLEGIAPSSVLPVPDRNTTYSYFNDPERLDRLIQAQASDLQKWGAHSSYHPDWIMRGKLAAAYIADEDRVLEIGSGTGTFRALVSHRCHYTGADLHPVTPETLTLNLETDALPSGPWDVIVLLGVLEYIYDLEAALRKFFAATNKVVISYCCIKGADVYAIRRLRGWVNDLGEPALIRLVEATGFSVASSKTFNKTNDFEQKVFLLKRNDCFNGS